MYDELVEIVNVNDTSGFLLKTHYNTDKLGLWKKITDTSGLIKKTDSDAKISEIGYKIPSITSLATTATLSTVKDKIPKAINLQSIS